MADKKIKRWRVEGTDDSGWVDGDGYRIMFDGWFDVWCARGHSKVLPVGMLEIEYEDPICKPRYNNDGTCGGPSCPLDDGPTGEDCAVRRCGRHNCSMLPNIHLCPDAVVLKSEAGR